MNIFQRPTEKRQTVSTSCSRKTADIDRKKPGGDDKINIVVASYKPDVRCNSASGPPWDSCLDIFDSMPADKNRHMFGHLPDQRVQTGLPMTYQSRKIPHAHFPSFAHLGKRIGDVW